MARRKLSLAKLERLSRMQAQGLLSEEAMAVELDVSVGTIEQSLALPQVQERVEELVGQYQAAGERLASSRARWAVGRLIQLSSRDDETGRKALVDLLKLALSKDGQDGSSRPALDGNSNEATEQLTQGWSENEWNTFAKLLSGGGPEVSPAPAAD